MKGGDDVFTFRRKENKYLITPAQQEALLDVIKEHLKDDPSVEIIKNFAPEHPVHVFVPPTQKSFALASKCDHVVWLEHYKARFVQSMLPEDVTLSNGHVLHRPTNWR